MMTTDTFVLFPTPAILIIEHRRHGCGNVG